MAGDGTRGQRRAVKPGSRRPTCEDGPVARLRLFAAARDAAGVAEGVFPGASVDAVLAAAAREYGDDFDALLRTCRVWVNGEQASGETPVTDDDEVAVLPPVSGGC